MLVIFQKIKLQLGLIIIISCFLGVTIGRYFCTKEISITYISQDELLELEKARLVGEKASNRQLFFGTPEKAIKIIEVIQESKSKDNNIVLLSEKAIYGSRVKSISKEVHAEVLRLLKDLSQTQGEKK